MVSATSSPRRSPKGRAPSAGIPSAGIAVAVVLLLGLAGWFVWDRTRTFPTPTFTSIGYAPQEGDVVFQSLPGGKMTTLIEGVTDSPLSHCGIVALDRGRWVVIEAVGPVMETPLERWIDRGRGRRVWAYRLALSRREAIPAFVAAARSYLGRPYDPRYRMDDERIYCSELVHKSYAAAGGETLCEPVALGDLDWRPHAAVIRELEGGDPPLERLLVTPRDLARAALLQPVFGPDPDRE